MYYIGLLFMFATGLFCGVVAALSLAMRRAEVMQPIAEEPDAHELMTWPAERFR